MPSIIVNGIAVGISKIAFFTGVPWWFVTLGSTTADRIISSGSPTTLEWSPTSILTHLATIPASTTTPTNSFFFVFLSSSQLPCPAELCHHTARLPKRSDREAELRPRLLSFCLQTYTHVVDRQALAVSIGGPSTAASYHRGF